MDNDKPMRVTEDSLERWWSLQILRSEEDDSILDDIRDFVNQVRSKRILNVAREGHKLVKADIVSNLADTVVSAEEAGRLIEEGFWLWQTRKSKEEANQQERLVHISTERLMESLMRNKGFQFTNWKAHEQHLTEQRVLETFGSINSANRTIPLVVIKPGWSDNNVYYDKRVLAQLPRLLMDKPKMFFDHRQNVENLPSMHNWASTLQKVWQDADGSIRATAKVVENPKYSWIVEEARTNPAALQVSLDSWADVVEAVAPGGRKGQIVSAFNRINSLDWVCYGAVKGAGVA